MSDSTPPSPADIVDEEFDYLEEVDDLQEADDVEAEDLSEEDSPPPEGEVEVEEAEEVLEEYSEEGLLAYKFSRVRDDSVLTFDEHRSPVFSCDLHPTNGLCATGGQDDKVYLWNRYTGDVEYEINSHKDTVTEVHFSHDGKYLASGDMAGGLLLHKIKESAKVGNEVPEITFTKVWEYKMGDMSWMRWHRGGHVLLVGSDAGEVYMFRLPIGEVKILPGEGITCSCGEITSDGRNLFAGYSNGTYKLWDLKSGTPIMQVEEEHPMAHGLRQVTAVACDKNSPLYVSGDDRGRIIFSTPSGPVGMVEARGTVETLAFSPSADFRLVASGTLGGQIAVWDPSKLTLRVECQHRDDGIIKVYWMDDVRLLAASEYGNIYVFDGRTGERKYYMTGHVETIYTFKYDRKEHLVLTACEDRTTRIFRLPFSDTY